MKSLEDVRNELEVIDSMIAELLKKRLDTVRSAGSEPLYSKAREAYIMNRVLPDSDSPSAPPSTPALITFNTFPLQYV